MNWNDVKEGLQNSKRKEGLTIKEMSRRSGVLYKTLDGYLYDNKGEKPINIKNLKTFENLRKLQEGGFLEKELVLGPYQLTGSAYLEKEKDMILRDIIFETPYKGKDGKPIIREGLSDLYVDRLNYLFCKVIGKGELNKNPEYGRVTVYSEDSPAPLLGNDAYIYVTSLITVDYGKMVGTKSKKFEKELKDAHVFGVVNARICKVPRNREEVDKAYNDKHPFKKDIHLMKRSFIKPEGFVSLDQYLEEDPKFSEKILQNERDYPPKTQSIHILKATKLKATESKEEEVKIHRDFISAIDNLVGEKYKGQTYTRTRIPLSEIIRNIRFMVDPLGSLTRAKVEPTPKIEGFNLAEKFEEGQIYSDYKIVIPNKIIDVLRDLYFIEQELR